MSKLRASALQFIPGLFFTLMQRNRPTAFHAANVNYHLVVLFFVPFFVTVLIRNNLTMAIGTTLLLAIQGTSKHL